MPDSVWVESLDLEAQGIARLPANEIEISEGRTGKVLFIKGALPTERVSYVVTRERARFNTAKVLKIFKPAVFRTEPKCKVFGICGGCSMQHLDIRAQIAMKQRVLEDDLKHISKIHPQEIMRPISGPAWEYRHRARFSVVNRSIKKGTVLVGFHEGKSGYVADMIACEILPLNVSKLLPHLRNLLMAVSIPDFIPQIELAVGEAEDPKSADPQKNAPVTALVFRHLKPFNGADKALLMRFAEQHCVWIWLQPKGIDSVEPFYPKTGKLCYRLPEFEIEMPFEPADFIQVNHLMNRALVSKAIQLMAVEREDRVLDLFCGIGNFSLPLARVAQVVLGIEGLASLTSRARLNAEHNRLACKAHFQQSDLFLADAAMVKSWGSFQKWLIDPPREGAMELSQALATLHVECLKGDYSAKEYLPKRIVYVSCNPKTLARDVEILCKHAGYELQIAGIVNMFPHTSHVESIAVFERMAQK